MKTSTWVILLVFFSAVSFKLGIDLGIRQYPICDSPYKAFIHAISLEQIDNKQVDRVKLYHQLSLTDELINSGKYLEYGKPYTLVTLGNLKFAKDVIDEGRREYFLNKAVEYRKSNPIEWPYDLSVCAGNNIDESCQKILGDKKYYDKTMNNFK